MFAELDRALMRPERAAVRPERAGVNSACRRVRPVRVVIPYDAVPVRCDRDELRSVGELM